MKRRWGVVTACVAFYAAVLFTMLAVMRRPVVFGRVMRRMPEPAMMLLPFKQLWFIARAGSLKAGDPAPDFKLWTSDKRAQVELASFRHRAPVVLIFGSYT